MYNIQICGPLERRPKHPSRSNRKGGNTQVVSKDLRSTIGRSPLIIYVYGPNGFWLMGLGLTTEVKSVEVLNRMQRVEPHHKMKKIIYIKHHTMFARE